MGSFAYKCAKIPISGHDQLSQICNSSKPTLSVLAHVQLGLVLLESRNTFITPSKRKLFVLLFWQGSNEPNKPLPHFRVELDHCGLIAFGKNHFQDSQNENAEKF